MVTLQVTPAELSPALCVDLDGTLVQTDTLHEQLLLLVKSHPLALFAAVLTLARGLAAFKRAIAERVKLRPELLPYHDAVIAYLRKEASQGRRLLLVTAADQIVADDVSNYLRLFESTLASDGVTNLKATEKVRAIRRYLQDRPFDYIGNSYADIPVWKASSAAIVVGSAKLLNRGLQRHRIVVAKTFCNPEAATRSVFRAMRVYQWSKNILVFVPVFLSHTIIEGPRLVPAIQAFVALCAAASAIYIVNDLLDLEADRAHSTKRHRPLAAGFLSISRGTLLSILLLGVAAAVSSLLPAKAQLTLAAYVGISLLYSARLKRMLFIDITALAALYTLRILYGGAATGIVVSAWALAFSIFMFTSLAICKRLAELRNVDRKAYDLLPGRPYHRADLPVLTSLGSASGYVAVLVLALYINSPEVKKLYRIPGLLWCLCPVLSYWISRMLIIANRGALHEDPILFAFRDRMSQIAAIVTLVIVIASL